MLRTARGCMAAVMVLMASLLLAPEGRAQAPIIEDAANLPPYRYDRGTGVRTSMFGTYVRERELLVYLFYEYYTNEDQEYSPNELGYALDQDFEAPFVQSEWLIFLAYGFSSTFAMEFEAALYTEATQDKAAGDPTALPASLAESGLGDVQIQFDWDFLPETASRPGYFTYLEIVFPLQKDKVLIGTGDWEYKLGIGMIAGHSWGTLSGRISAEYDRAAGSTDLGEFAVEYLKRLSSEWRIYAGMEGVQDEIELITEVQYALGERTLLKFNNAFGLTPKAQDWAPEIGVMWAF